MKKLVRNTKSTVGRTTGQPQERHLSATKEARKIVRDEIKSYFAPSQTGYGKSTLDNMKEAAESAADPRYHVTDWAKGANLAQVGCFAIDFVDEQKMLEKLFGKQTVEKWNDDKIHNTYKNLIGKEYSIMLKERESKKREKKILAKQEKAKRGKK